MSGHLFAGWLATVLAVIAFFPSIRAVYRGDWHPSPVSWWIWAALDTLALVSTYTKGGGSVIWQIAAYSLGCLIMAVLATERSKERIWTKYDRLAGFGALISLIGGILLKSPSISLAFSMLSFALGSIPTYTDTWLRRQVLSRQQRIAWLLFATSSFTNLLAVQAWGFGHWEVWVFAVSSFILNFSLSIIVLSSWKSLPQAPAVFLYTSDGRVLMQHRDDSPKIAAPNLWWLPGGASEPGELPEEAAIRELEEETGYRACNLNLVKKIPLYNARRGMIECFFFSALYDETQRVACYEGQEMVFISFEDIPNLPLAFPEHPIVQEIIGILEMKSRDSSRTF